MWVIPDFINAAFSRTNFIILADDDDDDDDGGGDFQLRRPRLSKCFSRRVIKISSGTRASRPQFLWMKIFRPRPYRSFFSVRRFARLSPSASRDPSSREVPAWPPPFVRVARRWFRAKMLLSFLGYESAYRFRFILAFHSVLRFLDLSTAHDHSYLPASS